MRKQGQRLKVRSRACLPVVLPPSSYECHPDAGRQTEGRTQKGSHSHQGASPPLFMPPASPCAVGSSKKAPSNDSAGWHQASSGLRGSGGGLSRKPLLLSFSALILRLQSAPKGRSIRRNTVTSLHTRTRTCTRAHRPMRVHARVCTQQVASLFRWL